MMWWRVDKDIDSDDKFTVLRNNIISAPVFAPNQRTYGSGDSLECYVITPEGLKLGIKGIFRKEKYYKHCSPHLCIGLRAERIGYKGS